MWRVIRFHVGADSDYGCPSPDIEPTEGPGDDGLWVVGIWNTVSDRWLVSPSGDVSWDDWHDFVRDWKTDPEVIIRARRLWPKDGLCSKGI